ncbi:response regulator [Brevundimonas nasdae]|uniref:histidine kinase n=1 Tax=Brevundimonas nasdae TaxID=172043 RepID=A0ABX8TLN5_9CAUL|nr:response regulator [Brevundimonas nasdae]QYC11718.1 response regulator [Brevundimonas nasdae]QYC14504.1 response regulator [Brevundimonas nasdae]
MIDSTEYVRAYAERYRDLFPVRLASVAAVIFLTVWLSGWVWGIGFFAVQGPLYVMLWRVTRRSLAQPDAPGGGLRLKRWTEAITLALAVHNSLFVLAAWRLLPDLHIHLILLISGVLMVGALQAHASRLSFAAAVVPPMAAIFWITFIEPGVSPTLQMPVLMLTLGVVSAAWRQWRTDRETVRLMLEMSEQSQQLQAALSQSEIDRAAAERANQAKSRFLAMISHEVRTPLNVVLGLAEVLKRRRLPSAEAGMIDDMADAGGMLLRLLNGALDISKIESGQSEVQMAPADLAQTLTAIVRVWGARVEELNLSLELELLGRPEDFVVQTDVAKVEQVIINFLSNALKLTPNGVIRIVAQAQPASDGAVALSFEVHDQGPGVPQDQRERIFQPFEQLEAGRAVGGAGLGLAICRASVLALGGDLGVRAAQPHGAVFWFGFTAERTTVHAVPLPVEIDLPPAPHRTASPPADDRPSILIAEDHPANRKLLALLLEPFDINLVFVENGKEALDALSDASFDLVLMDAMMPVMDGITALTAIRATEAAAGRPRALVHMLTANVFEDDVARYMQAGADGVLRKPIEIDDLHRVVQQSFRQPLAA